MVVRVKLWIAISILGSFGLTEAAAQYRLKNAFPDIKLADPVDLQSPKDGSDRLFVVELVGRVVVFPNDPAVSSPDVFLDIHQRIDPVNGGALLGLAFHPDYENNGFFYLNYTNPNPPRKVVSRFSTDPVNPNRAIPESELVLLEIPLEMLGHDGGQLAFGPDGFLYVSTGDGNPVSEDSSGNGQDPSTLPGSLIRIDVDAASDTLNYSIPEDNPFVGMGPGFREEVFAYGLRNPWRFSFDSLTGTLWLADVGAASWEEVNIVEKGLNYGWSILEGAHCFDPPTGCSTDNLSMPVWEYGHDVGRSITGGYVYRGNHALDLYGKYLFADWTSGRIWTLSMEQDTAVVTEILDTDFRIPSFGVDADDELYVLTIEDSLYQIVPQLPSAIEDSPETDLSLHVYPNPAVSETSITYELHRPGHVVLDVYNLLGVRVRRLEDHFARAGARSTIWDGRDAGGRELPSGIYYLRLQVDDRVYETQPIVRAP